MKRYLKRKRKNNVTVSGRRSVANVKDEGNYNMEYKILYNDYGPAYIVQFADERYMLVNTDIEEVMEDTPDILMKFGMWTEDFGEIEPEMKEKIDSVIRKNKISGE